MLPCDVCKGSPQQCAIKGVEDLIFRKIDTTADNVTLVPARPRAFCLRWTEFHPIVAMVSVGIIAETTPARHLIGQIECVDITKAHADVSGTLLHYFHFVVVTRLHCIATRETEGRCDGYCLMRCARVLNHTRDTITVIQFNHRGNIT